MSVELNVQHPITDIDEIYEHTQHSEVRTSPHVGNLDQLSNPHYLALGKLGVFLEMVNSISVSDKNGRPWLAVRGDKEEKIFSGSKKERNTLIPAAAIVNDGSGRSLEEYHLDALQKSGIRAMTTTHYFAEIGVREGLRYGEVLEVLFTVSDQPVRHALQGRVSNNLSLRPHANTYTEHGVFGIGEDETSGLLLPLSAMMSAEIVEAVIGQKDKVRHIGGADMTIYTKDEQRMQEVVDIANKALAELGINSLRQTVGYTVYNKNGGIKGLTEASDEIAQELGVENFSQHDLVDAKTKDTNKFDKIIL